MTSTTIDVLRRATGFLRERGVGNPRLDAEVLLADVLGVDRVGVYLGFDRPLTEGELDRYREVVRRRGRREPLQHIRRRQEFFSRDLVVDGRALVPRPETEILVEEALAFVRERPAARILDVGTGSGAIAVTLALEAPSVSVFATDVSSDAVALARENAARLGAAVEIRNGDLFGALATERFDLVVSNPPYLPSGEIAGLDPEVREFDPRAALDGGPDGLGVIRRIIATAPGVLEPGGALMLEIGAGQDGAVAGMLETAGLVGIRVRADLSGHARVISGRKP